MSIIIVEGMMSKPGFLLKIGRNFSCENAPFTKRIALHPRDGWIVVFVRYYCIL